MRIFLLVALMELLLFSAPPAAFERLGQALEKDVKRVEHLRFHPYFSAYSEQLSAFRTEVEKAFVVGHRLDKAIREVSGERKILKKEYLQLLRLAEKEQKEVERLYVQALEYAMKNDDLELFALLLEEEMEPVRTRTIRKRLQNYYMTKRELKHIDAAESMLADIEFNELNRQEARQEREAYEENLRVIAEAEAARLRKMTAEKRQRNVIVSTKKSDDGYDFFAENLNSYAVTITLTFKKIENFRLSAELPAHVELLAGERRKVLGAVQIDKSRHASFSSYFSWVMGRASARHNDTVLYRVPFARGSKVFVSQGNNGATTHKGHSRYSVDFSAPVGTPVYAARSGKVVAIEDKHSKGGFAPRYGQFANYIVIEHSDATLGKYYHLKQKGVVVAIGDHVKRGQLIGYTGNTGYSSGPHLHFSVSKVDSESMTRPITLPIRFKTQKGVVSRPKRGDIYIVG